MKEKSNHTNAEGQTRVFEWECVCVLTWAKMFCSLISFCRSRLGLAVTTDRTSWPLLGTTHTKNTRSSRSFVTNLEGRPRPWTQSLSRQCAQPKEVNWGHRTFFHSGQYCRTEASSQSTPGPCWRRWQSPSLWPLTEERTRWQKPLCPL